MPRELIFEILEYVIRIMIVVAGFYIPKLITRFKLERAVELAVWAAEAMFPGGNMGEEKKAWVIAQITSRFKISEEELMQLIEAAVAQINAQKKQTVIVQYIPMTPTMMEEIMRHNSLE